MGVTINTSSAQLTSIKDALSLHTWSVQPAAGGGGASAVAITVSSGNTTTALRPAFMSLVAVVQRTNSTATLCYRLGSSANRNASRVTMNITFSLDKGVRLASVQATGSGLVGLGAGVMVRSAHPFGTLAVTGCGWARGYTAKNPSAGYFGAIAAFNRCSGTLTGNGNVNSALHPAVAPQHTGPPGLFYSVANPYATLAGEGPPPPPSPPAPPGRFHCGNFTMTPYGTRETKWSCGPGPGGGVVITSSSPVAFGRLDSSQLPVAFAVAADVRINDPPHNFPCGGRHGGVIVGMASKSGTEGFGDGKFDGYSVTLSACAGWVTLARLDMGQEHTLATHHLPLAKGAWHSVRVVSNGAALSVSINGTVCITSAVLPHRPLGCTHTSDACSVGLYSHDAITSWASLTLGKSTTRSARSGGRVQGRRVSSSHSGAPSASVMSASYAPDIAVGADGVFTTDVAVIGVYTQTGVRLPSGLDTGERDAFTRAVAAFLPTASVDTASMGADGLGANTNSANGTRQATVKVGVDWDSNAYQCDLANATMREEYV